MKEFQVLVAVFVQADDGEDAIDQACKVLDAGGVKFLVMDEADDVLERP